MWIILTLHSIRPKQYFSQTAPELWEVVHVWKITLSQFVTTQTLSIGSCLYLVKYINFIADCNWAILEAHYYTDFTHYCTYNEIFPHKKRNCHLVATFQIHPSICLNFPKKSITFSHILWNLNSTYVKKICSVWVTRFLRTVFKVLRIQLIDSRK